MEPNETATVSSLAHEITDDYNIIKLLGSGGMGDVYLAEHRLMHRFVAIKVLKPHYCEDPDLIRRFEDEAIAAGKLDHPNVVRVYDCRSTKTGGLYVAMEYLKGESLAKLIREQGFMLLETVIELTNQIASGLGAAHRENIVHRDVKPGNIIVSFESGRPIAKIVDFGIARLLRTGEEAHTIVGNIVGSASYMSPEQAEGLTGNEIDSRADIYSLGLVVYEMLGGRPAFKPSSWPELIHKQRYELPKSLRVLRPDLSVRVEAVINRALSKNRTVRQSSALEFAAQLAEAALTTQSVAEGMETQRAHLLPTVNAPPAGADISRPNAASTNGKHLGPDVSDMTNTAKHKVPFSLRKFLFAVLAAVVAGTILIYIARILTRPPTQNSHGVPATTEAPLIPTSVLKYEVMRERRTPSLRTLPPDNTFHSGENFYFRVQVERPGLLYLLHKNHDGSMKWVNPEERNQPQMALADQWVNIPKENWIGTKGMDQERFLLIYVPAGFPWSLEGVVHPQNIVIGKSKFPEFSREAATRLLEDLKGKATRMSSSSTQNGDEVINNLVAPREPRTVVFHEFVLTATP